MRRQPSPEYKRRRIPPLPKESWGKCQVGGCLFLGELADNLCIKHFDNYRRRGGIDDNNGNLLSLLGNQAGNGPESWGKCKYCKATKQFQNWVDAPHVDRWPDSAKQVKVSD